MEVTLEVTVVVFHSVTVCAMTNDVRVMFERVKAYWERTFAPSAWCSITGLHTWCGKGQQGESKESCEKLHDDVGVVML